MQCITLDTMTSISVRIDSSILKDLTKVEKKWQTDRSEAIRRLLVKSVKEWKIENALEEIRQHKKSVGKAAEECELSKWEILELLKNKNIDWTGYSKEDLEEDLIKLR